MLITEYLMMNPELDTSVANDLFCDFGNNRCQRYLAIILFVEFGITFMNGRYIRNLPVLGKSASGKEIVE